ncbi:protein NTM1-like 9 [Prosopis cineraria]|uniref:protein NTM1-like 9 n=1 Tax=Prosopis cineraria TaxID=364024 RepID=UPI00240F5070|nr:protein NTM1-like 9 [Prosopis cineraria]
MADPAPLLQDMPKGFRFLPTDEELVRHCLHHKFMNDDPSIHDTIPEIDVCKHEPWELPEFSLIKSDDPQWFFFSHLDYKYPGSSTRSNRATSLGYWKATGKERKITERGTHNVIGTKKTLVFYEGRVPGIKTNWVIHEYHDALFPPNQRTHVLCRLMKKIKNETKGKMDELVCDRREPSNHMVVEYENQATTHVIPDVRRQILEIHNFSNMDSMIQTPLDFDSTDETPQEPEEGFDFSSFLLLSPRLDEQE